MSEMRIELTEFDASELEAAKQAEIKRLIQENANNVLSEADKKELLKTYIITNYIGEEDGRRIDTRNEKINKKIEALFQKKKELNTHNINILNPLTFAINQAEEAQRAMSSLSLGFEQKKNSSQGKIYLELLNKCAKLLSLPTLINIDLHACNLQEFKQKKKEFTEQQETISVEKNELLDLITDDIVTTLDENAKEKCVNEQKQTNLQNEIKMIEAKYNSFSSDSVNEAIKLVIKEEMYTGATINTKNRDINDYVMKIPEDSITDTIVSAALDLDNKTGFNDDKIRYVEKAKAWWCGTVAITPGFDKKETLTEDETLYTSHLQNTLHVAAGYNRDNPQSIVFNTLVVPKDGVPGHFEYFELRPNDKGYTLINVNSTDSQANNLPYIVNDNNAPKDNINFVYDAAIRNKFNITEVKRHCVYTQSDNIACGVAAVNTMLLRLKSDKLIETYSKIESSEKTDGQPFNLEQQSRLEHAALIACAHEVPAINSPANLQCGFETVPATAGVMRGFLPKIHNKPPVEIKVNEVERIIMLVNKPQTTWTTVLAELNKLKKNNVSLANHTDKIDYTLSKDKTIEVTRDLQIKLDELYAKQLDEDEKKSPSLGPRR